MSVNDAGEQGPAPITSYPDGRWTVVDHQPSTRFPLCCRGNTGEVYPNVVTPLTASIVSAPFARGQARMALDYGLATKSQLAGFDGVAGGITGVFGGYLYGNVSLARSGVARTPGLTVELVDRQMFGLSGAPPHRRGPGERDLRCLLRSTRKMSVALIRPRPGQLEADRRDIADYISQAPDVTAASTGDLLSLVGALAPRLERMMHNLLVASAFAGIGRSLLERTVATVGDDGLVNRLTAGLGTIESADPASDLWKLGRLVAADEQLTEAFRASPDGLEKRLHALNSEASLQFAILMGGFHRAHGSRGPDEWELASPTWGTDPRIPLAMIDRLRLAPDSRDPSRVQLLSSCSRHRDGRRVCRSVARRR